MSPDSDKTASDKLGAIHYPTQKATIYIGGLAKPRPRFVASSRCTMILHSTSISAQSLAHAAPMLQRGTTLKELLHDPYRPKIISVFKTVYHRIF